MHAKWCYLYVGTVLKERYVFIFSFKHGPFFGLFTSTLGLQSLTTGSMPLVARRHCVGCGWRQFTIESSPLNTRTMFVVSLSQIKKDPSSDPATTYWPLLKIESFCWHVICTISNSYKSILNILLLSEINFV